jgi:hypothetical protein
MNLQTLENRAGGRRPWAGRRWWSRISACAMHLQIRYQTGNKLVLHDNNKVVGILGDSELYHALLGKNLG